MIAFNAQDYGAAAPLLADAPLCPLGPGQSQGARRDKLEKLDAAALFSPGVAPNRSMADCCLSALWLLYDFLDASHTISQSVSSAEGSYWHGVMHRREPDYSNAKYWFNRVGDHPIFPPLSEAARELAAEEPDNHVAHALAAQTTWNPHQFVDLCQAAAEKGGEAELLCRRVAEAEWRLLFDYCYRAAVAS